MLAAVVFRLCGSRGKAFVSSFAAIALSIGIGVAPAALASPASAASPSAESTPSPEPSASLPPEVALLEAKIEAAAGKRPGNERIVATIAEYGRTKTRTTFRSGKNVRVTLEDGPFTTAGGTFESQAWRQIANGLTILDQPRPGLEASERETVEVLHVTAPLNADVIARLDPKGDGTKTYVDPGTSRIVRLDEITPNETSVTTYDDFRTTAGYVRAWHVHTSDGHAENDSDERVVSIAIGGVSAADVAVAPPRRALVSFPAGTTKASLPVQLDSHQQFVIRVMVGSRGLDCMLDTGSSDIVLDRDVALGLGLKLYSDGSNASNAGRYSESAAIVPEMKVGPLVMKDVAVGVIPALGFASPDAPVKVVGLLGFDFIASLALSLDYEHGSVSAVDYDAFAPPPASQAIALPIRVGEQGPETDVSIDGHIGEHFQIDTGGVGGVMITDAFTRRYPGVTRGFRDSGGHMRLAGVGGVFETTLYTIPNLRLGTTTFPNFSALVLGSNRLYARGGFDGVIGPELLRYFTLTTDYADSTIYLEPNGLGKKSMKATH